jgi:hypothetical protein
MEALAPCVTFSKSLAALIQKRKSTQNRVVGNAAKRRVSSRTLLVAARDESSGVTRPTLRPGLYIYDARDIEPDLFYVFFWPEDATWDDATTSSAARNRVTFMRSASV